jgi:hypothetical protein
MQLTALRTSLRIGIAACVLTMSAMAQAEDFEETPSVGAMVADTLLVRPLYFIISQAGAVLYSVTLPFTLMGGNSDEAAEAMVVTPLQAAFVRCLGCGKTNYAVSEVKEGAGKTIDHFVEATVGTAGVTSESESVGVTTLGVFFGTRFELVDRSRFDVLLGYQSLGEAKVKSSASLGAFNDTTSSIQVATRFGRQIFKQTDLMFKLGLHRWSTERETASGSTSTDGFGLLYGVGLDVRLDDAFGAGLGYTRYDLSSDGDGYDSGINSVDLGLRVYF